MYEYYYVKDNGDREPIKSDWRDRTYEPEAVTLRYVPNRLRERYPGLPANNIWLTTPIGSIYVSHLPIGGTHSPLKVMYKVRELYRHKRLDLKRFLMIYEAIGQYKAPKAK